MHPIARGQQAWINRAGTSDGFSLRSPSPRPDRAVRSRVARRSTPSTARTECMDHRTRNNNHITAVLMHRAQSFHRRNDHTDRTALCGGSACSTHPPAAAGPWMGQHLRISTHNLPRWMEPANCIRRATRTGDDWAVGSRPCARSSRPALSPSSILLQDKTATPQAGTNEGSQQPLTALISVCRDVQITGRCEQASSPL